MKLTFLLLTAAFLNVSATGLSQNISFSGKNISLKKAFAEIKRQTGYFVIYTPDILAEAKPISINVENTPINEFLDKILSGQNIEYTIEGKRSILLSRKAIVAFPNRQSSSSNRRFDNLLNTSNKPIDVKGRVVNEKGEPLEGVTVTVKGTNNGTSTNEKGEFSLKGVDENAVLLISYVGFEQQELKVSGKTDLIISMERDIKEEEAVTVEVNTGYQRLPKERATGSFVQINNNLLNRRVSTNVMDRLEGVASGLVFNPNYNSLSGVEVKESPFSIRGRSTIFGNVMPLIIVDNFPYDGDLSNINPNSVESITILKDAAAASIWGVRAGNGVIVITTKKGQYGTPLKVQFNSNITIGEKPDLFYDPTFLKSSEFIDVEKTLFSRGFYDADISSNNLNSSSSTFPVISPVVEILRRRGIGQISAGDSANLIGALIDNDVRNDLSSYFYRKSFNQQYSIDFRGGSDKASYFFNFGYDKNRDNQIGSSMQRFSLNSSNVFRPIKKLELNFGAYYTQSEFNSDNIITDAKSKSNSIYPYAIFIDNSGQSSTIVKDYSSLFVDSAASKNYLNWQFYPINEIGQNTNKTLRYDVRFAPAVRYIIIPGLNVEVKYQYERQLTNAESFATEASYYTRNLINQYSVLTNGKVSGYNIPRGGILYNRMNSTLVSQIGRGQLSYSKSWSVNSINTIAGIDIQESKVDNNFNGPIYGYDQNLAISQNIMTGVAFPLNPNRGSSAIPFDQRKSGTLDRFRSYYVNAAYAYMDRYMLSASGRLDQSNLFGVKANQKTVPLWSVGGKWNINNEKFYKLGWLPQLAVRLTYGFSGNLNKSVAAYTTASYTTYADNLGNYYTAAAVLLPGNPELTWEKISIVNMGLDFGLRNNVLNGSIEYYEKNGDNIFGDAFLPTNTGFTNIRGNFANMTGHGVDLVLNSKNVDKAIKWSTSFLFSYTEDKITKYSGKTPGIGLVEGRPVLSLYSNQWGGLDNSGEAQGYLNHTLSKNYSALNVVPYDQLVYSGRLTPKFFGSLRNTFEFKNFSLSANFAYKLGYVFRKSSIWYSSLFNSWRGHVDFEKRWQKPGDEKITDVPGMPQTASVPADIFYSNSEVLVRKGDHIRFQDVNLTYDFKKSDIKFLPLHDIQLYLYANNLGILWRANNDEIDPDYQQGYPNPRTYSIGIKVNF